MTYEECEQEINENTIIVIPSAGGTKEHGYHLPMGTDMYVTKYMARCVTKACNVITLPIVSYAYYPAFIEWKGSVSLGYETSIRVIQDIIESYVRFGVKKYLILDGGVSTQAPMRILSSEMFNKHHIHVAISSVAALSAKGDAEVCEQKSGGHGDESETSCMLFLHPELVHMEKAFEEYRKTLPGMCENGQQLITMCSAMDTPHGITGNAKLATAEKGKIILDYMAEGLIRFLTEFEKWNV